MRYFNIVRYKRQKPFLYVYCSPSQACSDVYIFETGPKGPELED